MTEIVKTLKKGESIRLVQISDCHLSRQANALYRGGSADSGLKALLPAIAAWNPHIVMATGDLSEDASRDSYDRLKEYLQTLCVPVCVLPGNHDEDDVMQSRFALGPWGKPLILPVQDWRLVLLKSSVSGRIDGSVSEVDLSILEQGLNAEPEKKFLLALHHQPVKIGSLWIDRHRLQNPKPLMSLIRGHKQVKGVVWGHVHQVFETEFAHARGMSCPSTAANSLAGTDRFEKDGAGPACRWLILHPDGAFETGLLFAADPGRGYLV